MYTLLFIIYVQAGLTVSLSSTDTDKQITSKEVCEYSRQLSIGAAGVMNVPGYEYSWRDAVCVKIRE